MLVALTTNPSGEPAQQLIADARTKSDELARMPEAELVEYLIQLIARIPTECPDCGKGPSHGGSQ